MQTNPLTVITPEPLTAEAFAEYGDVIELKSKADFTINHDMAERFHDLARIDCAPPAAISLVRSRQYQPPFIISELERHPLGSQAFIPLQNQSFIVVVAGNQADGSPGELRIFKTDGGQGVQYHKCCWHGLLLTPFAEVTFLCVDYVGDHPNCEVVKLPVPEQRELLLDL